MPQVFNFNIKRAKTKPYALIILDGWGVAPSWGGNAVTLAKTNYYDKLIRTYPNTTLSASGPSVGLSEGSPGNSEAGHLNIGAGRIVHQDLPLINKKIESGDFFNNKTMKASLGFLKKYGGRLHLMGLLSKTGTHSHLNHLYATLKFYKENGVRDLNIHLFSDGRDSDPMSGIEMISEVQKKIDEIGLGRISSIMGRFYAMDRDNRWGRTIRAYNTLVRGEAEMADNANHVFSDSYKRGITDEFIEPRIITNKTSNFQKIENNDVVLLFNFRPDRVRQLTKAFLAPEIKQFTDRQKLNNIMLVSFVTYERENLGDKVFYPDPVENPIAKVISDKGYTQLHMAETEKYPHVTYFINGGRENPYPGETHKMIPSPKVRTYDYAPKMSAALLTKQFLSYLKQGKNQFYIINYANPDMVGHTGNLKAAMQAISFIDECLKLLIPEILSKQGTATIFADHGNAEQMINPQTSEPDTEHTTNPVPFILVNDKLKGNIALQNNGSLSNIAPTTLELLGVDKPNEMSSRESLILQNPRFEHRGILKF